MSPSSNPVRHTNYKCGIGYGTITNLNYLICLLFVTYSSANLKFVIRFAVEHIQNRFTTPKPGLY
jgi:hypothetical protein